MKHLFSEKGMVIYMKISTKGRYALRMMIDIAASESDEPIRLKDIAFTPIFPVMWSALRI